MKSLYQHIDEKLRVNKDYENIPSDISSKNDEFYKDFKTDYQWLSSHNRWFHADHINAISYIRTTSEYRCHINDKVREIIPKSRSIFYYFVNGHKGLDIYKRMNDWLDKNQDDMTFVMCDFVGSGIYGIRIFEDTEHLIGVIGRHYSVSIDDDSSVLLFAYK